MKNITALLQQGNLTPRERYLMLIHNDANRVRTGKEILSEADKQALENWHAKDNREANEWNRLNSGWKHSAKMDIETEFIFLSAQTHHFRKQLIIFNLLSYQPFRQMRKYLDNIKQLKKVTIKEAVEIGEKQRSAKLREGLDFDYAVYQLAFENLAESDQEKLNELYADVETDHQYLDQEEIIANLFKDKNELTQEETKKAKEKIAELVAERAYNSYAKEYQLYHYFACIPLAEVARHFLTDKGIEVEGKPLAKDQEADDEDSKTTEDIKDAMENYAKKHKLTIEAMLKEACLKWLDEDLLDQYTPLVFSNENELLNRWLATKTKARATLQKFIIKGELKIRKRVDNETRENKLHSRGSYVSELETSRRALEVLNLETVKGELSEKIDFETFNDQVITGESLYAFKGDHGFIKDFQKWVDKYNSNLGMVYADNDLKHTGEHLDQDLLICDLDDNGEPIFFSFFGMSVKMLATISESDTFFKETKKGKEIFLEFKSVETEKFFKEEREKMINDYSKLLAFLALFKKLSEIYETDLAWRVKESLEWLDKYIDQHNRTLTLATGQTPCGEEASKEKSRLTKQVDILKIEEDWFIDKDKIIPDPEIINEHQTELKDILGGDF